jgi:mannosyl-3-phosphoglycerate phosphatase
MQSSVSSMPLKIVTYTDLDGTLLDHSSYSYSEALPALRLANSLGVPVVFCSSKTRAELEIIRLQTSVPDPFIVENGGAIFVPKGYFAAPIPGSIERDHFHVLELGTPYPNLVSLLERMARELGVRVRGFHQMTAEEIAGDCGLSLEAARRALLREYDEPFEIASSDERTINRFTARAKALGLRVTRGGRYFHLMGDHDKGRSVAILTALFRRAHEHVFTVGLGDSLNDLPMLQVVDFPILVQRPDADYDEDVRIRFPGVHLAEGVGPKGWNLTVKKILEDLAERQAVSAEPVS